MLTTEHLYVPLLAYSVFANAGMLPLIIDLQTCGIQVRKLGQDWCRSLSWYFLLTILFIRGALAVWKAATVLTILHKQEDALLFYPILILIACSSWIAFFVAYLAFQRSPEVTTTVFNGLLQDNHVKTTLRSASVQEIAVLMLPWNVPFLAVVYGLLIWFHPKAQFSLYSYLPLGYHSVGVLAAVCILEVVYVCHMAVVFMFITTVMLLFFQKCVEDGRYLLGKAKQLSSAHYGMEADKLRRFLGKMRQQQLLISLYNQGYAFVHLAGKTIGLICAVVASATGIVVFHSNIQLALFYISLGVEACLLYCILFHKAFSVPLMMRKLRLQMTRVIKTNVRDDLEKREMLRFVRSVPPVGIKNGQFHTFERMSTPKFLGFSAKNITRLVIGFRKT